MKFSLKTIDFKQIGQFFKPCRVEHQFFPGCTGYSVEGQYTKNYDDSIEKKMLKKQYTIGINNI